MKQKPFKAKSIQPMNPDELRPSPELIEVQQFMPMSSDDRARLKKDIEASGEIRDAIKVYFNKNDEALILGGKNRWEIARELGWTAVPIEVYDLSPKQRKELALMDNLARRHLTRDQKNKVVELFLKVDPIQSNRVISKKAGVDDKTVGQVRKRLETTAEIPQLKKRQGADGRARTSTPERPARAEVFTMPPPMDEGDFVLTSTGYVKQTENAPDPPKGIQNKRDKNRETQIKEQIALYLKSLSPVERENVREDFIHYINMKSLN